MFYAISGVMVCWRDAADDISIIYVLMVAALFIVIGAQMLIFTYGCSSILIIPGVLIIYIALQKSLWVRTDAEKQFRKSYPHIPFPPPRTTQTEEEYGRITKPFYRKLNMPTFGFLLFVFFIAIVVGLLVLLTIETRFGTLAWIPFIFIFVIGFSFPSFMWISLVYSKDLFTPEPARNIMVVLTWGMLSVIPAVIGEILLDQFWAFFGFSFVALMFLGAAVNAPFIEEFFKPLGLKFVKFNINTKLDGLIYGVTAGMGFAMIENLGYEFSVLIEPFIHFSSEGGVPGDFATTISASWALTSLIRGLSSTIGHAVGAGMIGMAFYTFRNSPKRSLLPLISAFAFAVTLHMGWNAVVTVFEFRNIHAGIQLLFIILFPVMELMILINLIKICKKELREQPYPEISEKLFKKFNLPPPVHPYFHYYQNIINQSKTTKNGKLKTITEITQPVPGQLPESDEFKKYIEEASKQKPVSCPKCKGKSRIPPPQFGRTMICPYCYHTFSHSLKLGKDKTK